MNRYPVTPRRAVAGLVQNVNDDVFVAALLVAIGGVEREGEVVDGIGEESDALSPRLGASTSGTGEWGMVPITLIVNRTAADRRLSPARITLNRHSRCTHYLVGSEVEHHVVTRELAVELTGWIERMILPAIAIVHDDFRIPLCEIEAPALPTLASRQRRGPSLPFELGDE